MSRIRNIIFDLDGTLIDSSDGVVAAFHHAFRRAGLPLPPRDEITRFIGYSLEKTFAHFTDCSPDLLREYFREKAAETIVASTSPLPHVESTLRLLRARGYRTAIATTKIVPNIEGILDKLNWRHLFDTYAGGNEVSRVKPDPEEMLLVLTRLGAQAPETVVVGDTINDILAARAASLLSIAVASPFEPREKVISSRPDYFVESISDLPQLLERINTEMETLP